METKPLAGGVRVTMSLEEFTFWARARTVNTLSRCIKGGRDPYHGASIYAAVAERAIGLCSLERGNGPRFDRAVTQWLELPEAMRRVGYNDDASALRVLCPPDLVLDTMLLACHRGLSACASAARDGGRWRPGEGNKWAVLPAWVGIAAALHDAKFGRARWDRTLPPALWQSYLREDDITAGARFRRLHAGTDDGADEVHEFPRQHPMDGRRYVEW